MIRTTRTPVPGHAFERHPGGWRCSCGFDLGDRRLPGRRLHGYHVLDVIISIAGSV